MMVDHDCLCQPELVLEPHEASLEVVFAGVLCFTGLTGVTYEVKCLNGLTGLSHRSDQWSTVSSSVWGEKV
jgi:hypothetical protein